MEPTSGSADTSAENTDGMDQLRRWVDALRNFRSTLTSIPARSASEFLEAATGAFQGVVKNDPPQIGTPANPLILEIVHALLQLGIESAEDERVTVSVAQEAVAATVSGAITQAQDWLVNGPLAPTVAVQRVEEFRGKMQAMQDEVAARIAAENSPSSAHGALLGYTDPAVDAAAIFTQVCSFTDEEHERYSAA